jgi:hypothetical protein
MKKEQEILNDIWKETQETNRLFKEMKDTISAIIKKIFRKGLGIFGKVE